MAKAKRKVLSPKKRGQVSKKTARRAVRKAAAKRVVKGPVSRREAVKAQRKGRNGKT